MSRVWNHLVNFATGKGGDDIADSVMVDVTKGKIVGKVNEFSSMFEQGDGNRKGEAGKIQERKANYTVMVNHYYDIVTDFYEYGWGQSFHFAPRFPGESFAASIARHEYWLAHRVGLKPGDKVLDVGAGVAGPLRNIAHFSGANIVGVNNNDYQIERANKLNRKAGLEHLARMMKSDFMKMPVADGEYDAAYAIEATCHAPDKVGCYSEIFRCLKPGAYFGGYEWCVTANYDEKNQEHFDTKYWIEKGDSLPTLATFQEVIEALTKAGFEVLDYADIAQSCKGKADSTTWYSTLQPGLSLETLKHSTYGRWLTHKMVTIFEYLGVAPEGTLAAHDLLTRAADALARGGELEIFTPMFFFLCRKSLDKKH